MSARGIIGRGAGVIGAERLGAWRTNPADQAGFGPPLLFTTPGTFRWRSEFGVLYRLVLIGGGGAGVSAVGPAGLGGGGGGGGAGVLLWWVGDGNYATLVVGAAGSGATTFTPADRSTALSTAGGGASGSGQNGGAGGTASGAGLLINGQAGGSALATGNLVSGSALGGDGGNPPFGFGCGGKAYPTATGFAGTGHGAGGAGGTDNYANSASTAGIIVIERALPAMNSVAAPFEPLGGMR